MSKQSSSNSNRVTPLAKDLIPEIKQWHYKMPQRNPSGGYSNFIQRSAGDFQRINFQATAQEGEARCTAPFGISKPYDQTKEDSNKRNFELTVRSQNLMSFLQTLDENTVQQAISNAPIWWPADEKKKKKVPTEDRIRDMYRPLIQTGDETKGYESMFRTKVTIKGGETLRVYVYQGMVNGKPSCRLGALTDITSFVEVIPIIEVVGMWFMSDKYGLSLLTTDVVVFPKSKRDPGMFNFNGQVPVINNQIDPTDSKMDIDEEIVPTDEAAAASSARNGNDSYETYTSPTPVVSFDPVNGGSVKEIRVGDGDGGDGNEEEEDEEME